MPSDPTRDLANNLEWELRQRDARIDKLGARLDKIVREAERTLNERHLCNWLDCDWPIETALGGNDAE